MNWRKEAKPLALIIGIFLILYWLPIGQRRFDRSILEAFALAKWYAREHVILCLIPAFFIAGAIGCFVSQGSVIRYLGPAAKKVLAYSVASVSGSVLAVCSCTVLPLFAGIYTRGAGLGPATAFLYAGPAVNVLAIILTARILGAEFGIARAIGAVAFSIVIGLLMHLIFRKEETTRAEQEMASVETDDSRPLWKTTLYFAAMVAILVFATWGHQDNASRLWAAVYTAKWWITGAAATVFAIMLVVWFGVRIVNVLLAAAAVMVSAVLVPGQPLVPFSVGILGLALLGATGPTETRDWVGSTWGYAKQMLPLLFAGVLVAGALLGRPGEEGLIPPGWIAGLVGGNSLWANLFASVVGAFMYFATLTEVPILQGLLGAGMGKGPALALLLAGPALSLPNMLVIRSVMGTKRTAVYILLVVVMATISGMVFGAIAA
jgi:uncharacterized membrane protein YraQ (UPF0718 family)